MARIRSVKPELRTDLTVASWPREARYAWVLLWGYLDDKGRGVDDTRLLVADLFPLDKDVTERKFDGWKRLWVDGGQICRYEVDGRRFLHAIKWHHQRINRPTPSRLPPCPTHHTLTERHSEPLTEQSSEPLMEGSLRARKEQGAGSREEEQGAGSRERVSRELTPAGPPLTHTAPVLALLDAHGPYVAKVRGQLAQHLDQLLTEGHPTERLDAALADWTTRDRAAPGLLPDLVQDQLRRTHHPTARNTGPRSRAADTLALAAQLDAAHGATP